MDGFKNIDLDEQTDTPVVEKVRVKSGVVKDSVPLQNTPPLPPRRFNFVFKKKPLIIAFVGFLAVLLVLAWQEKIEIK